MNVPPSTESRPRRWLALLWLLLALAAIAHSGWVLRGNGLTVDLFALLPEQAESAWQRSAVQRATDTRSAEVVVLLGAADDDRLPEAMERFRQELAVRLPELRAVPLDPTAWQDALATWQPQRHALLSREQLAHFRDTDHEAVVQQALATLLQPVSTAPLPWSADPLQLAAGWWQAHNPLPMADVDRGQLRVHYSGTTWNLLRYRLEAPAFSLGGERRLGVALDAAREAAAGEVGELRVLYAGVPLHADAAAAQASREMSTIGLGSLFAVLLLVLLAFGSLRPILLVASSLLVGTAVGLSSTVLLFGEVHVLTLVFGASLVGVAEDYGIHYFSARQAQPEVPAWRLLAQLRPSLRLALVTSVLAYLALGTLPFPGLRQMAWFSASGLCGAFVCVLLWFPSLDGGAPRLTRFATRLHHSLARVPALPVPAALLLTLLLVLAAAWPLRGVWSSDDLRQLQGSPAELMAMQVEVGRLLQLASPAQFYLVEAEDEQALLEREEALLDRLQPLRGESALAGWVALSDWVPSARRQADNRAVVAPLEAAVRAAVAGLFGETTGSPPESSSWTIADFASSPLAALQPELQNGEAGGRWHSLVLLRGPSAAALPQLAAVADGLAGVRWIDRTADYGALLRDYRERMSVLLLLGFIAVALLLHRRYGRCAWRAWLPTALAILLSVAALSQLGEPVSLFTVLALLLLLGIGVDYGIFLLDHGDGAAWMAVVLGATSTLLAFGLLGLSATPALRSFGLTLLFGIGSVWLLSPLYRPPGRQPATHH